MGQVHFGQLKGGCRLLQPCLSLLHLRFGLREPGTDSRSFADLRLLQLGFRLVIACLRSLVGRP